ncbi:MAG: Isopropylmalate/citramalate isomerase large subunit [Methanomassiliicoccales archaeon PtaU1.Bin124]|nr:MAG: Isopropylmalate/citramalate isomerase large subunit [Methanomassiliicoccales archaeon PtaU1.Bin124]
MGTIAEEILSNHAGKKVKAGEIVVAPVDYMMSQDGTTPLTIKAFQDMGGKKVLDPSKYAIVIDHNVPSPIEGVSNLHKGMRDFATAHGVKLYDIGEGVCHTLLPESGKVLPGMIVIGADSHTTTYGALNVFSSGVGSTDMAAALISGKMWFKVPQTIKLVYNGKLQKGVYAKDVALHMVGTLTANGATYKALELYGDVIDDMSVEGRMTISNLAVETGAKAGLMSCDERTKKYLADKTSAKFNPVYATMDAQYERVIVEDLSKMGPQIACPPDVDNVAPIEKVEGMQLDQVYIGTCTNGRYEDLEIAAKILDGKQVHKHTRLIVAPSSKMIYLKALESGIIAKMVKAGAAMLAPSCGPCVGTCNGVPSDGEKVLSTANRNFKGRMGNTKAEIYLSSPAVAAYSAIKGCIADPREVL